MSAPAPEPRAPRATDRLRRQLRTPKAALALALVPLLAVAASGAGWGVALPHLAAALAGATLVEMAVTAIAEGGWRWPSSALLSGLIVGSVLDPRTAWPVTLTVGGAATASKYLLAGRRGHVFNPAGLALLASIPLFATEQSWWGALADLPWPWLVLLLAGGAFVVDRVNKFPLALAFLGGSASLFTATALVAPTRVAEMFRPPFLQATMFLACFMLTDPPTTPGRYRDQVWIGAFAAVVSVVSQLAGAGQAYLLLGLLAANLAVRARRRVAETRLQLAPEAVPSTRGLPGQPAAAPPRRAETAASHPRR